ncbi:MAG: hypothetical protein H0T77_08145 [Pyrinomonadaceae bacterium]|nr:hypothetical protein [Pyrinomonadaceae bacterium]
MAIYLGILENGMGGAAAGRHRRPQAAIFVLARVPVFDSIGAGGAARVANGGQALPPTLR